LNVKKRKLNICKWLQEKQTLQNNYVPYFETWIKTIQATEEEVELLQKENMYQTICAIFDKNIVNQENPQNACIQCFFVVWNRVDVAISTLRQLFTSVPGERGEVGWPKYETIHVIEESVNANEYDGSSRTVPITSHTHTSAPVPAKHSSNGSRKGYKQVRTPKRGGGGTKRNKTNILSV
jgi:hypothetical protein